MKIVILTGSPHADGTTALLADRFIEGARAKNHEIFRFDAAFKNVDGCRACGSCREHDGACVQKDDMEGLYAPLLDAGLVVFVTPLYYFGMTAQLKAVVDRFFAVNGALMRSPKRAMLLAACNSVKPWAVEALKENYLAILRHLNWEDSGVLLAQGMGRRADIEKSDWPQRAEEMGLSL
jgi:multimeric flavodoxin WrbA